MRTASGTNYTLRALVLAVPMDVIAVVMVVVVVVVMVMVMVLLLLLVLLLLVPLLLRAAAEGWRGGGGRGQHQAGGWAAPPFRHILRLLLRRRRPRLPLLRLLLRLLLPRPETFAVVAGGAAVRLAGAGEEGMTPRMGRSSARGRQVGEAAVVVVVVGAEEVEAAAAAALEGTLAFSAGEEERGKAVAIRPRSMPSTA